MKRFMGKRNSSNLSFKDFKVSQKGVMSIILGMLSFFAAVALIVFSTLKQGKADEIVGACGVVAIITALLGLGYSVAGAKEADCAHLPAYLGFVINVVIVVSWCCLFVIGL